jgi:putative membrane protein
MAITHTFLDFISSVFLGAPEEDSFLSVLPGHEMLKEGRGYEAIILSLYGSLVALPLALFFAGVYLISLESFYGFIRTFIPHILIFISLYLVFREKDFILAGFIYLLAASCLVTFHWQLKFSITSYSPDYLGLPVF